MRNYFVYRHIRLDRNEPFYIGMGTSPKVFKTYRQKYRRAYSKSRNKHWKRISEKTAYRVDIIGDFNNKEDCIKCEEFFIDLYKTRNSKSRGVLCNIMEVSNELPNHVKVNISKKKRDNAKKVYRYFNDGTFDREFNSVIEAWEDTKSYSVADLWKCIDGNKNKSLHGFRYSRSKVNKLNVEMNKKVYQFSDGGVLLNEFKDSKEASIKTNTNYGSIRNCLSGISNTANGFYWNYENEFNGEVKYKINIDGNVFFNIKSCAEFLNVTESAIKVAYYRKNSNIKGRGFNVEIWKCKPCHKEETRKQRESKKKKG